MQIREIDTPVKKELNILILADYSEGNMSAIYFAMRYLYRPGSLVHIIQTWQKPNFGSSMVRDLSPMLENIAIRELENLRNYLKERYSMPDNQLKLISYEGDLSSFFKSERYKSKEWQVVLGSTNYENLFSSKGRMNEIINNVSEDLFVLTGEKNVNSISDVFMLADTPKTNSSNLSILKKIAISEKPNIKVCLSSSFESSASRKSRVLPLIENCKGAKLSFSQFENGEGQKEIQEFSKNGKNKLVVFEKNSERKFQNGLKACLDSWLLKRVKF